MSVGTLTSSMIKSVKSLPRKIFGTRNDRLLKVYHRHTPEIGDFEAQVSGDFDQRFAAALANESTDDLSDEQVIALQQRIRVDESADLRQRCENLRERITPEMSPLESWWHAVPEEKLQDSYLKEEYRKRFAIFLESLDREDIIAESFAVLREASRRAQQHRHFDSQLIGGRVLFEGKIAEMKTGEGKTIVCHLAAFVRVLCGHKVHVVTVNDYLVQRDAEFAAPIFELLGITVGFIQSQLDPSGREGMRQHAYSCDVTYGTNSEFGFDYLRDNMKTRYEDQVQGPLDFVIVDEVDSILIDEARTPLIISGPAEDDVTRYGRSNHVAEELVRRQVAWDRKVRATVSRYDGQARGIPKLDDAMNILGYKKKQASSAKDDSDGDNKEDAAKATPEKFLLGPDFLTDDQVEAIQIYENDILQIPPAEQYRRYFITQLERKQVGLTHEGVTIAQELLDMGSLYSGANMEWPHLIENALRAHKVYQRDTDYVVQDGEVIIVDQFTGRLMHGRQWSDGLHQSVEAREHVQVKEETQTLATITIQNFIKLYKTKAGMTGTALTEASEFDKIYQLEVIEIPTNRPVNRVDHNDKMYRDVDEKYNAIVEEIREIHRRGRPADPFLMADVLTALKPIMKRQDQDTSKLEEALRQFNNAELGDRKVIQFMVETYDDCMGDIARGRPVLVGTTSVENSEKLSNLLSSRYGIDHEVLNAKNHSREADIVAKAGFSAIPDKGPDRTPLGNVTIATNMAGRGTDIKLGPDVVYKTCKVPEALPDGVSASKLYPANSTKCCINCLEYDAATNCAHCYKPKLDPRFPELGRKVCSLNVPCGLHIIATERHESRRIDNQLRGRSGRQGDPGSSRFSLSLADELLKLFMSDWMLKMMERLGFTDGSSLEDKRLTKGIERAQRKVEERNFSMRKHLLEWDEPMDFQRKEFYSSRQRILEKRDLPGLIFNTTIDSIVATLDQFLGGGYMRLCIAEWCRSHFNIVIEEDRIDDSDLESSQKSVRGKAIDDATDEIRTSLGEYIDPDESPNTWDVGGLLHWAQRSYKVSLSQNQMRKMEPRDIEDALCEAARQHFNDLDLSGLSIFVDPRYPYRALADWSHSKFDIKLDENELAEMPIDEIRELVETRVQQAYEHRQLSYPVEWCMERAFSDANPNPDSAPALVMDWANAKYDAGWAIEDVQGLKPLAIQEKLLDVAKAYRDTGLARQVDEQVARGDEASVVAWAKQRFGAAWNQAQFDNDSSDLSEAILKQGHEMLRWELTRLEQFVLLRIYDQAWKDHLLEMDHLKSSIMQRPLGGDQSHPQSQYSIEGRDLFRQMWVRIANRVTDVIFKVRATTSPQETAHTSAESQRMTFGHADSTGAGFSGASRDESAAMKAQGAEAKTEPIRREEPKIKRNDPCPCGSGKKYKQCHGRNP